MRLVVTLLARDEADVIAETLDHYLAMSPEHVIVCDNASADGTRERLEGYRDRGLITLLDEPGRDHDQGTWVTRMARTAATEHGADWVVNADADELWVPVAGATLQQALAAVPDEASVVRVPVLHFRPRPGDGRPWPERLTIRETFSVKPGGGLSSHVCHRGHPEVTITHGVHNATAPGFRELRGWWPLRSLHFPMRTRVQYVRKISVGGQVFKPWLAPEQTTPEAAGRVYDGLLVDDAAAAAGIRRGALVLDTRVRDRLAALRAGRPAPPWGPAAGGGALAWPELPPEVAELRAVAMQELYTHRHSPDNDDLRRLHLALKQLPAHVARRLRERLR